MGGRTILVLSIPAAGDDTAAALARAEAVIARHRDGDREAALEEIEVVVDDAQSPLANVEHALHPYVAYGILPLFAFANAGIDLRGCRSRSSR